MYETSFSQSNKKVFVLSCQAPDHWCILWVFVTQRKTPCHWCGRIRVLYLQLGERQKLHPGLLQIWGHPLWWWWTWGEGSRRPNWLLRWHHGCCNSSRCVQADGGALSDEHKNTTVFNTAERLVEGCQLRWVVLLVLPHFPRQQMSLQVAADIHQMTWRPRSLRWSWHPARKVQMHIKRHHLASFVAHRRLLKTAHAFIFKLFIERMSLQSSSSYADAKRLTHLCFCGYTGWVLP